MIQTVSIQPHQIKSYTCVTFNTEGALKGFPLLSVDRDSYLTGVTIQSGINFDPTGGRHCVAIGKCCSLAESITFMIDLNHDYKSVCQGEPTCLQGIDRGSKIRRKASIILQNDVWIGHGATIMAGVTLHNGCVVAADSVVTKDVPPYAIVGGNPAKILRYRFDEAEIIGLQKIAWWDWDSQVQYSRRQDFVLPISDFVSKYLPEAERRLEKYNIENLPWGGVKPKDTYLFIPDFGDPYPLYPKVLKQYFEEECFGTELFLYLPKHISTPENLRILDQFFEEYKERNCEVVLQSGETWDENILFQYADYFITTRSSETVLRTCLADLYQTKILYGTDEPFFCLKGTT